jgi:glucan phosphoethanolaminetransferase (alkaline phosphatase superfamily)
MPLLILLVLFVLGVLFFPWLLQALAVLFTVGATGVFYGACALLVIGGAVWLFRHMRGTPEQRLERRAARTAAAAARHQRTGGD